MVYGYNTRKRLYFSSPTNVILCGVRMIRHRVYRSCLSGEEKQHVGGLAAPIEHFVPHFCQSPEQEKL